ncbi:MAG: carboxypeptidase regulatory-like domain-containing protein [Candidatus Syntrophosphaera sp.]|nr:carboxypeptidase regulatory-like domain-containing protein [Candidatus Syntrophosphaera sp.]
MKSLVVALALILALGAIFATAAPDEPFSDGGGSTREIISVTIGSGDQQAQIPVNMYYRTSLFETIYLASEMNVSGEITAIRFYNNFYTNIPNKPTQIWLGETYLTDLANGWIPASQLTQVFSGNVDYPAGINEITINLNTPYTYGGGNLVLMAFRPWDDDYYFSLDLFQAQTVGSNRSLNTYNHNTPINPDNPPTTGVTGQFPKTTFFVDVSGRGALLGNVSSGGSPLSGATVTIQNTNFSFTTGADGNYDFPYVPAGTYQATASKTGYPAVSHTVTIAEGQTTTQDFVLAPLPQITVSGRAVGSDAPTEGLANAQVSIAGYAEYSATSDATGSFSIPGVYASQTYNYNIGASGYQNATGEFSVGAVNYDLGDIVLSEIAYPPQNVVAAESANGNSVDLAWEEPNVALEGWLHYDSGENNTSFGTAGSLSFDVAIRFPPAALADYAGGFLQAVRIWPAMGGNFSVRVWTGGDAFAPGMMVVDQPIIPVLNSYNTVLLDFPIPVTGTEELWFGFLCDVTGVNPAYAGMDYGPAVDGFGNMIHWQGSWTTLLSVNAYCDFNWNIQGYVGLNPPAALTSFTPLALTDPEPERITAYQVWRFLQGQANNEALWVNLTPGTITETTFTDTGWYAVPDGTYYWAVKSVYINGVLSDPAFSNPLTKVTPVGTIAGIVRSLQNAPIMDATVSCGDVSATTNASGAYSMLVESGAHSVTASHPNYQSVTQDNVLVVVGQTTTLNFQLPPGTANEDPIAPVAVTALHGNYPNPFNPETTVTYSLKEASRATLQVFNLKGQLVATLVDAWQEVGNHSILWQGLDHSGEPVSSGIYQLRMSAGGYRSTKKMILLK